MDSLNNGPRYGGDAWLELQAFKTRQINRREKLNRHKDLINGIATSHNNNLQPSTIVAEARASSSSSSSTLATAAAATATAAAATATAQVARDGLSGEQDQRVNHLALETYDNSIGSDPCCKPEQTSEKTSQIESTNSIILANKKGNQDIESHSQYHQTYDIDTVECILLLRLCDVALKLPIDSGSLSRSICKIRGLEHTAKSTVENLLEKFAHQELITIEEPTSSFISRSGNQYLEQDDESCIYVISADHTKLVEFNRAFGSSDSIRALMLDEETSADVNVSNHSQQSNSAHSLNVSQGSSCTGKTTELSASNLTRSTSGSRNSLDKSFADDNIKRRPTKRDDVESLLSLSSTREKESKKLGEELLELLSKPTAKERNLLESFRSADGYQVQEFCPKGTKDDCRRNMKGQQACDKLHFKKIIAKHTEESLGDCSFLNTCFHMDSCKYVHYEVDYDSNKQPKLNQRRRRAKGGARIQNAATCAPNQIEKPTIAAIALASASGGADKLCELLDDKQVSVQASQQVLSTKPTSKYALSPGEQARIEIRNRKRFKTVLYPPQWIQCDLRYFDMTLLGKFSVVMADPPWDIHMNLPYGTMSDDEMRKLNVPALQDDGVIFLWVTGRAMELGRECLALWGYERADEILWVKTNQLQRIIRTGRTGHWLNHGKEHCLVGVKGFPNEMNRGLDCDIIVAEVRATSHKPDEIYGIIERLSPGTRKIELFGRAHNVQPNWITLGNQLDGVRLVEPTLIESFKKLNLPYETADHAV